MSPGHVKLAEPVGASWARELVPADQLSPDEWLIRGTPGLVTGCAAGDRVRVSADNTFEVVVRGGNVAVHVYSDLALPEEPLLELRRAFKGLGGLVEWPEGKRFAVVTVPVTAGFPAIEELLARFVAGRADTTEWEFGNVYDADDVPLEWWA